MQIRAGILYRNREGQRRGPMKHGTGVYPWICPDGRRYGDDGRYLDNGTEHKEDLIGLWALPGKDKMICDVTLDDYRRGFAQLYGAGFRG